MQAPALPAYHPTGPHQAQATYPPYPQYPSQPSMPMPAYGSGGQQPYGYGASPVTPHEPAMAPAVEGKRSTLMRDIAIGVAIAAVVLGGFFVVKFVILDKSEPPPKPTIATIRLSMTPGVAADLFVDDKKIGAVSDKQEIPVTAGNRHVALVGPNGTKCDEQVTLEAGKTTTLECKIAPPPPGNTGSAAVVTGSGAGSATMPTTTTTAGSAATVPAPKTNASATTTPTPSPHPGEVAKVEPKPEEKHVEPPKRPETMLRSEPTKAADASGKGYLTVTSKPSARIAIDGVDTGLSTPISGKALSLTPGKHRI